MDDNTQDLSYKHTPGPWRVEDHTDTGDWRSTGLIWSGKIKDGSSTWEKICQVNEEGVSESNLEEFEANAKLIAAAPDLLAACERAVFLLQKEGEIIKDIKDAINKAIKSSA